MHRFRNRFGFKFFLQINWMLFAIIFRKQSNTQRKTTATDCFFFFATFVVVVFGILFVFVSVFAPIHAHLTGRCLISGSNSYLLLYLRLDPDL